MSREIADLAGLLQGQRSAWDGFVLRYSGIVLAAIRRVIGQNAEAEDIMQDVFVRLCKEDYRLLRQYDADRASLSTWLTIVARSVAHDAVRRRRFSTQTLDDTPESALSVEPAYREKLNIPAGLLSPRQHLVLGLLYDQEMDVSDAAKFLGVDPQTIRSTHHKAMLRLRAHFQDSH